MRLFILLGLLALLTGNLIWWEENGDLYLYCENASYFILNNTNYSCGNVVVIQNTSGEYVAYIYDNNNLTEVKTIRVWQGANKIPITIDITLGGQLDKQLMGVLLLIGVGGWTAFTFGFEAGLLIGWLISFALWVGGYIPAWIFIFASILLTFITAYVIYTYLRGD